MGEALIVAFCACGEVATRRMVITVTALGTDQQVSFSGEEVCARCEGRARAGYAAALHRVTNKRRVQPALPGLEAPATQREESPGQVMHRGFQDLRRAKLEALGVDFVEDERPNPAHLNALRLKWVEVFGAANASGLIVALFRDFLEDPWAASLAPPFPFRALASDRVWRARADKLLTAHRPGAH